MLAKKIAVLVSGGGTNLQALIDHHKNSEIKKYEISAVISNNENAYALT
ncbi:MAG: phosphoribosylglycinamide formyltransferase, partial [Eubacteriales bacterium]|nr:phosphoribosylglycinamide formyltransferase [Eubacteriales bacterium]